LKAVIEAVPVPAGAAFLLAVMARPLSRSFAGGFQLYNKGADFIVRLSGDAGSV
jgi:hypothetical protein